MSGDIKRLHEIEAMSEKERRSLVRELDAKIATLAICGAPCEHDFQGWREFSDGNGGEQVCTKCGMGAMAHSLRTGP